MHAALLARAQLACAACCNVCSHQTRDPQLKVPPGGLVLRIFTSWTNPSISAGFEPANLGSRGEHGTPRPPSHGIVFNQIDSNGKSCIYINLYFSYELSNIEQPVLMLYLEKGGYDVVGDWLTSALGSPASQLPGVLTSNPPACSDFRTCKNSYIIWFPTFLWHDLLCS